MKIEHRTPRITQAEAATSLRLATKASASGSAMVFVRGTIPMLEGTFNVEFSRGLKVPYRLEEVRLQRGNEVLARVRSTHVRGNGDPAIIEAGRGEGGHAFSLVADRTKLTGGESGLRLSGVIELSDGQRLELTVPNSISIPVFDPAR